MNREKKGIIFRIFALDLILVNSVYLFFLVIFKKYDFSGPKGEFYGFLLVFINLLWIIICIGITKYRMVIAKNYAVEVKKIFLNIFILGGIISGFAFIFKKPYSRIIVYGSIFSFLILLIVTHLVVLFFLKRSLKKSLKRKTVLVVGKDRKAMEFYFTIKQNNQIADRVLVFLENQKLTKQENDWLTIGKLKDIEQFFIDKKIDEMFLVFPICSDQEIADLVEIADHFGTRVRMVPGYFGIFEQNFKIDLIENIPIININEIPLDNYYNAFYKRSFDIVFSLFILLMTLPLHILIALLVKLTSKGPVFFIIERVGLGGELFKLYKYRTMKYMKQIDPTKSTVKNDSRITKLGKYLRKFDLDELPQFFNSLKGDMSIVGPRPHREYLDKMLQNCVNEYMIRHYIKPGITGWAQVNGWRGPTETDEQKANRTRFDLWYLRNWSVWLDFKIILLTVFSKKTRMNGF